jgi:hypothetical protein
MPSGRLDNNSLNQSNSVFFLEEKPGRPGSRLLITHQSASSSFLCSPHILLIKQPSNQATFLFQTTWLSSKSQSFPSMREFQKKFSLRMNPQFNFGREGVCVFFHAAVSSPQSRVEIRREIYFCLSKIPTVVRRQSHDLKIDTLTLTPEVLRFGLGFEISTSNFTTSCPVLTQSSSILRVPV